MRENNLSVRGNKILIVIAAALFISAGAAQAAIYMSQAGNVLADIKHEVCVDINLDGLETEQMFNVGVAWPRLEVSSELGATEKTSNASAWRWNVDPQYVVPEREVSLTSYFNLHPCEMATTWTVNTPQDPVRFHGNKLSMQTPDKNNQLGALAGESLPPVSTTVLLASLSG